MLPCSLPDLLRLDWLKSTWRIIPTVRSTRLTFLRIGISADWFTHSSSGKIQTSNGIEESRRPCGVIASCGVSLVPAIL